MRKLLTLLTFFSLLVVAYAQSLDAFEINASMPQICYADETFTFRHFSFEEIRENMKCKTNIIKVSTSIQMAIDRMPERLKKSFHGFDGVYIFGKTDEVMIKSDSFPGLVVSNTLFLNEKLFNGEFSLKNRYNTSSYFRLTPKEPGQEYPSFKIINESTLDILTDTLIHEIGHRLNDTLNVEDLNNGNCKENGEYKDGCQPQFIGPFLRYNYDSFAPLKLKEHNNFNYINKVKNSYEGHHTSLSPSQFSSFFSDWLNSSYVSIYSIRDRSEDFAETVLYSIFDEAIDAKIFIVLPEGTEVNLTERLKSKNLQEKVNYIRVLLGLED